jgi:hypothetical protein
MTQTVCHPQIQARGTANTYHYFKLAKTSLEKLSGLSGAPTNFNLPQNLTNQAYTKNG